MNRVSSINSKIRSYLQSIPPTLENAHKMKSFPNYSKYSLATGSSVVIDSSKFNQQINEIADLKSMSDQHKENLISKTKNIVDAEYTPTKTNPTSDLHVTSDIQDLVTQLETSTSQITTNSSQPDEIEQVNEVVQVSNVVETTSDFLSVPMLMGASILLSACVFGGYKIYKGLKPVLERSKKRSLFRNFRIESFPYSPTISSLVNDTKPAFFYDYSSQLINELIESEKMKLIPLYGPPGSGKTAAIHRFMDTYAKLGGNVEYHSLSGPISSQNLLDLVFHNKVREGNHKMMDLLIDRYLTQYAKSRKPNVIVIDNSEHIEDLYPFFKEIAETTPVHFIFISNSPQTNFYMSLNPTVFDVEKQIRFTPFYDDGLVRKEVFSARTPDTMLETLQDCGVNHPQRVFDVINGNLQYFKEFVDKCKLLSSQNLDSSVDVQDLALKTLVEEYSQKLQVVIDNVVETARANPSTYGKEITPGSVRVCLDEYFTGSFSIDQMKVLFHYELTYLHEKGIIFDLDEYSKKTIWNAAYKHNAVLFSPGMLQREKGLLKNRISKLSKSTSAIPTSVPQPLNDSPSNSHSVNLNTLSGEDGAVHHDAIFGSSSFSRSVNNQYDSPKKSKPVSPNTVENIDPSVYLEVDKQRKEARKQMQAKLRNTNTNKSNSKKRR